MSNQVPSNLYTGPLISHHHQHPHTNTNTGGGTSSKLLSTGCPNIGPLDPIDPLIPIDHTSHSHPHPQQQQQQQQECPNKSLTTADRRMMEREKQTSLAPKPHEGQQQQEGEQFQYNPNYLQQPQGQHQRQHQLPQQELQGMKQQLQQQGHIGSGKNDDLVQQHQTKQQLQQTGGDQQQQHPLKEPLLQHPLQQPLLEQSQQQHEPLKEQQGLKNIVRKPQQQTSDQPQSQHMDKSSNEQQPKVHFPLEEAPQQIGGDEAHKALPSVDTTTASTIKRGPPASRRLMVFVDGSHEADRAFYTAIEWLHEGDHLSAVYVVDAMSLHPIPAGRIALFGSAAPGAEEAAHAARERVHRLISRYAAMARETQAHNVQCVAVSTAADRNIKEEAAHYAQQIKADVVFAGTRGLGAIKRFFIGSFANYLLNNCICDVMVVKGELPEIGRHHGDLSEARESTMATAEAAHRSLHEGEFGGFAGHSFEQRPTPFLYQHPKEHEKEEEQKPPSSSSVPISGTSSGGIAYGEGGKSPLDDASSHESSGPLIKGNKEGSKPSPPPVTTSVPSSSSSLSSLSSSSLSSSSTSSLPVSFSTSGSGVTPCSNAPEHQHGSSCSSSSSSSTSRPSSPH